MLHTPAGRCGGSFLLEKSLDLSTMSAEHRLLARDSSNLLRRRHLVHSVSNTEPPRLVSDPANPAEQRLALIQLESFGAAALVSLSTRSRGRAFTRRSPSIRSTCCAERPFPPRFVDHNVLRVEESTPLREYPPAARAASLTGCSHSAPRIHPTPGAAFGWRLRRRRDRV